MTHSSNSFSKYGFLRGAAIAPVLRVAEIDFNASQIKSAMESAVEQGARLAVFPELSLTGYTSADLFYQDMLHFKVLHAMQILANATGEIGVHVVVGLPWVVQDRLYNCAALLGNGKILGLVPKQFLPNTGEYYEKRWFSSGIGLKGLEVDIGNQRVPFGTDLIFCDPASNCTIGLEICEDLWAVQPPSGHLALAGANLIVNLSASSELIGKAAYRRKLVSQQSARCHVGYIYASANAGESTTDTVMGGHCLIAENGALLAESERFEFDTRMIIADIDLERLKHERFCNSSFSSLPPSQEMRIVTVSLSSHGRAISEELLRPNPPRPFLPDDRQVRDATCHEILSIQSTGLAKRLKHTGVTQVVIGISGGLDSTLALLAAVHAFDRMKLHRKGIIALTMPGFGTTTRTRENAEMLVEKLGATLRIIPIQSAVEQHFLDIGHDCSVFDITYENAQARERTQILMDVANQVNGFVVGTGDLSEAALGWCTFNGDHMSMYHVNAGVPKTLVRYLIEWCADKRFKADVADLLREIAETPISPELLPVDADGKQHQATEDTIGPYDLHDFFLYHFLRFGSRPAKIFYLAEKAFAGQFDRSVILKWLEVFLRRFFSQQFKRSAMPDGPKVGSVALSPRGDWRMPSDASATEWLAEINDLKTLQ